ncbi:MAG: hypothetical protein ACJAS1_007167 [Oleiphilaceae bacterium]
MIDKHQNIIANIYLSLSIIVGILLVTMIFALDQISLSVVSITVIIISTFLLTSYALKRDYFWCHKIAIPISLLMLFSFPVGSLISGYYFWFLFNEPKKRPSQYSDKIKVTFLETETFFAQGTLKTGDQILTDQYVSKSSVKVWTYHVFYYYKDSIKYGFKFKDFENKLKLSKGAAYTAYLSPYNVKRCWFKNTVQYVYEFDKKSKSNE